MAPTTESKKSLLLLPALSLPLSRSSLRTAYKQTLEALLRELKKQVLPNGVQRLDIAIALSSSYGSSKSSSRTQLFPDLQTLFQEVYTLICVVAAEQDISLDVPGGLDVRLILLEPDLSRLPDNISGKQSLSGPLIDIPTFLSSQPIPSSVYSVESEIGISLAKNFTSVYQSLHRTSPTITRLPSGPAITTTIPTSPLSSTFAQSLDPTPASQPLIHKSIAIGGTFDHLHIGHKLLLTATILLASPAPPSQPRKITIGITGDALLVNKQHASVLESWEIRQQRCSEFVESILCFSSDIWSCRVVDNINEPGPNGKVVRVTYTPPHPELESGIVVNYTMIEDPYGPTITDEDISAMVVSGETRSGGKAVNDKRREKGWRELELFEIGVLDADPKEDGEEVKDDFESKISSTEIRKRLLEAKM